MHGCNRLVWLLDIARIAESKVDWDEAAVRLEGWNFGAGGYLVLALARSWTGASIPLDELRPLRPGGLTRGAFRRLLDRWDLSEPERDSRLRELFFATAADRFRVRAGLTAGVVVPPAGGDSEHPGIPLFGGARRLTLGTVKRIRGKLGRPTPNPFLFEYAAMGDQGEGRLAYLQAVAAVAERRDGRPSKVVVLSPSPTLGMSHYAQALAEAMRPDAEVVVLDGADTRPFRMWMRLRTLARDDDVRVLNTSPHWSAPLLVRTKGVRGGHILHDPILGAAGPLTRPLHTAYYRMLTRRLGVVVLHGTRFRSNVAHLRLAPHRVLIIPHGFVPTQMKADAPYDPRGPMVLLGRLLPYKGFDVLMAALRELEATGKRVEVIVGGEGVTPDLAPPDLPGLHVHPGALSDEQFSDVIGRCSAVLLPYILSTQSGVLATAFRAGRPVIATATGTFPEYVEDGSNGLLVAPGDPHALGEAIRRLHDDPGLATTLAKGARRTGEDRLAPKRAAREIVRALGSVP